MRKILYTFLIVGALLFYATKVNALENPYYTNNNGLEMTEQQYHNLLELGFTVKQIERMDYTTFQDNKDLEATLEAEVGNYYKTTMTIRNGIEYYTTQLISEEQYLEEMQLQLEHPTELDRSGNYYNGISANSYKYIITRISTVNDDYKRYKVDAEWLQMPTKRSFDIMGIGVEANKINISSAIVFRQDWTYTGGSTGYDASCYPEETTTGSLVVFQLPSGSLSTLQSYAYFNVNKLPNVGLITELHATGDYAHATATSDSGAHNNVSINYITGLVISSPYINYYDEIVPAVATFLGEW